MEMNTRSTKQETQEVKEEVEVEAEDGRGEGENRDCGAVEKPQRMSL